MFRAVIDNTPFTTEAANSYFENIVGDSFNRDTTFLATLRALVAPRMGEGDSISLSFSGSSYDVDTVRDNPAKAVINAICTSGASRGTGRICIHNFYSSNQDDNYCCLELVKSSFEKIYRGWHRLQKVTDFFRKSFYVICFINPERKSVYLFVEDINMQRLHYLQCAILAFLPWYFNPEDGVSELEMNLINSLRENQPEKYESCLHELSKQYNFRECKIKKLLAGFETRFEKIECDNVRDEIDYILDKISSLNRSIGEYLKQKSQKEIKLLGLETKIAKADSEESEIMEYFLCNEKLVIDQVDNNYMTFACKDYLEYFDEDMAKQMIDNDRSYVYRPNGRACNDYIPAEDMKKLMYAIFIDQIVRMKFCSAYTFQLAGEVRGLSSYHYGYEFNDCTPNTHIDRYSCLGNYQRVINECLSRHDYIGAIEQCIASCKSLNFADSTVMAEFMARLYGVSDYNVNIRCIELPDGSVVDPKEAISWIKSQEQKAQEHNETENSNESEENKTEEDGSDE